MRVLDMDGERHVAGAGDECCSILGKTCRKCGGFVHGQPVYGGIAEACENCDEGWEEVPDAE